MQVDNERMSSDHTENWYDRMMNPSKRGVKAPTTSDASSSSYRTVQPFDSNFLFDIVINENMNSDDFKFVSWKDFDIALESDRELYGKLVSLAKNEHELDDFAERVNVEQFVPMQMDGGGGGGANYREGNSVFYRMNRNGNLSN